MGFNKKAVFSKILVLFLASLLVITVGRWYEYTLLFLRHGTDIIDFSYLLFGVVYDIQLSVLLTPVVGLFYWGASRFLNAEKSNKMLAHFISVIGVVHLLLVSYFATTLVPLGVDLWGYSFTELSNTVVAANSISVWSVLALIGGYIVTNWMASRLLQLSKSFTVWQNTGVLVQALVVLVFVIPFILPLEEKVTQKEKRVNKLAYFLSSSIESLDYFSSGSARYMHQEYPLLHQASPKDVLGPYFKEFDTSPNIVFLVVESLGGEFVGPSGQWTGFAPFLDSLAQESLYWENGLSLSGRTFGLVPSLFGSLPFGNSGFMDLGPDYPSHTSLISLLDQRGYYTAFYSGYDTYFDGLDFFLEYQGTDFVLNRKRLDKEIEASKSSENYWGFDDKKMLDFVSSTLDTASVFPRLEIYHTLQSHSPFTVPDPQKYEQQFSRRLDQLNISERRRRSYRQYSAELTSLMFTDQALRLFMESYQQRKQYNNTIFVITGDHWLIPVLQTSAISRYHVPIMIYSPKLKKPVRFRSVNTHAEITPTLTNLLEHHTKLSMPGLVHWLGGVMDTSRQFRSIQSVPFMRTKNTVADYLDGEYYLYGDDLFELKDGMSLVRSADSEKKNELQEKLNRFKSLNSYVVENDEIFPGQEVEVSKEYEFLVRYDMLFARIDSLGLTIDEQFGRARKEAFDGNYEMARAIVQRVLLQAPEYHDARILIGRTYAWENEYDQAKEQFLQVLNSEPGYYDTYNAYFDSEYWSEDYESALDIINRGLAHHPKKSEFLERKIKALSALAKYPKARNVYEDLKRIDPNYKNLSKLKNYLSK